MKIILTGATGFVGANLQKYLKDHEIEPLRVRYKANQKFTLDTDAVIHLAGKAHDLKNVAIPSDYYEANFELTKQLFDSFLKSKANVFIFMSTVKAVADSVVGVLTEDASPNPQTHYGMAKLQAEQYLLRQVLPEGKRLYILRPCMIHGPGNKGNLNLLYKVVTSGLPWPLGGFENHRSFLSIENLNFAIKSLLENPMAPTGVYQIADDKPLCTNELITLIGKSQNKKIKIWRIPARWVRFMARVGDKFHLPFNSERLGKLTENYVVSNVKILRSLSVTLPVDSEAGLLKTFASFKGDQK